MDSHLIQLPKCYLRINQIKYVHLQKHDNPFFATFDNVLGAFHKVRQLFLGGGGCQMLTFNDMRGVGVLKMTMSAIFENPPLFFLESLVFHI